MSTDKIALARLPELIGVDLGHSTWTSIDQTRIDAFARCTGDQQWIHVNPERAARESPYGATVAHGFLTLALLAPACLEILATRVEVRQALNYGLDKVRFLAPVRADRRVRNHLTITAVSDKGAGRLLVTTDNSLEVSDEERPALIATNLVLLMG